MASINTDLKGIVALQKNYLDVLSEKTSDPDLTIKVNALQDQLSRAHTMFNEADISSSQLLTDQSKVKDIVDTEKQRLLSKKQSIDNALIGKKREIELNDSYQKKQKEYNKIKMAWIFTLAIYVLLTVLSNYVPFIPSFVTSLILIVVLVAATIYSINIYIEISRRDKLYFDKLDLSAPATTLPIASKKDSSNGTDLLKGMNLYGCVGSYCCSKGTKWDSTMSKCVHDATPTVVVTDAFCKRQNPSQAVVKAVKTNCRTAGCNDALGGTGWIDNCNAGHSEYTCCGRNDTTYETQSEQFTTLLGNIGLNKRRINIDTVKENYANEYDNYSRV